MVYGNNFVFVLKITKYRSNRLWFQK